MEEKLEILHVNYFEGDVFIYDNNYWNLPNVHKLFNEPVSVQALTTFNSAQNVE